LFKRRDKPKGKVMKARAIKRVLIFVAWGISGLGVPNGGFEVP